MVHEDSEKEYDLGQPVIGTVDNYGATKDGFELDKEPSTGPKDDVCFFLFCYDYITFSNQLSSLFFL